MGRTYIVPEQIESYCRCGDDLLVVLAKGPKFHFCGRTLLREDQVILDGVEELEPEAFLIRYGSALGEVTLSRLRSELSRQNQNR